MFLCPRRSTIMSRTRRISARSSVWKRTSNRETLNSHSTNQSWAKKWSTPKIQPQTPRQRRNQRRSMQFCPRPKQSKPRAHEVSILRMWRTQRMRSDAVICSAAREYSLVCPSLIAALSMFASVRAASGNRASRRSGASGSRGGEGSRREAQANAPNR